MPGMTTTSSDATPGLPRDDRWPRAGHWLAAGHARTDDQAPDLAFLGVPAHRTSLSPTGAHATPAAVRQALLRYSTYAASHGADLGELHPVDLGDIDDPDSDESRTTAAARAAVERARLLVACGGDNSITYAVMLGSVPDLSQAGLVTLDAHHDLRDGVSNGSPVRRLVEAGLPGSRVVQIGISDFANARAYSERAAELGITVISRDELHPRRMADAMRDALIIAGAGGGPVYVDLDVDVCDRAVAPGCPASVPGGLAAHELRTAAYLAGADPQVRAIDIAEVDATADTADGRTVRLAALLVLEAAAGLLARPA
jgi:formiminoglutamase